MTDQPNPAASPPAEGQGEPGELRDLPHEVRHLVHVVDRVRGDWAESSEERRAELWQSLHEASDAVWNRPLTPPADRTALRDRIAEALVTTPRPGYPGAARHGEHRYDARCALCVADVDALADAVLAVLPEPADRAAVLDEAADELVAEIQRGARFSHEDARQPGLRAAVELLRRMAAEARATDTQDSAARTVPCSAIALRVHHAPHRWEPQPGMGHVHCAGYPEAGRG
ncbi:MULTISPECIES: hypothetical protein [unclassified Streptomyces]|uniref:hypothetical protein n=1 Tax=unclassified Streptomyces TaxID=2593676 RepID=UPI000DD8874D|nr:MULTISPECIES: hypothetical protein [unclassified Streptomyces]QZZ26559.1 hypothetical protein A7X85_10085 [Streptomyces sp. ST1015]